MLQIAERILPSSISEVEAANKILIWGASGHALVVAEIIRLSGRFEIAGFIDDVSTNQNSALEGAVVFHDRQALDQQFASGVRRMIMGFGDCEARLQLAAAAREQGFEFVKAIHPRSIISDEAAIGAGTVVAAGAVISRGARVGEHAIINISASIDHDCLIEDGVHLAPAAVIGSGAILGRGAWIGIGAVVRNRVRIGAGAIIGAGAVVVKDIPDSVVAYGVPATIKRATGEETEQSSG